MLKFDDAIKATPDEVHLIDKYAKMLQEIAVLKAIAGKMYTQFCSYSQGKKPTSTLRGRCRNSKFPKTWKSWSRWRLRSRMLRCYGSNSSKYVIAAKPSWILRFLILPMLASMKSLQMIRWTTRLERSIHPRISQYWVLRRLADLLVKMAHSNKRDKYYKRAGETYRQVVSNSLYSEFQWIGEWYTDVTDEELACSIWL